jgi:hypothetical protein
LETSANPDSQLSTQVSVVDQPVPRDESAKSFEDIHRVVVKQEVRTQ